MFRMMSEEDIDEIIEKATGQHERAHGVKTTNDIGNVSSDIPGKKRKSRDEFVKMDVVKEQPGFGTGPKIKRICNQERYLSRGPAVRPLCSIIRSATCRSESCCVSNQHGGFGRPRRYFQFRIFSCLLG